MRNFLIAFLLLIVASEQTFGEEEQKIPREKISAVVEAYAGTIGCMFPLDEQNIVRFKVNGGYDGIGEYVVLYGIDPKCSGGSAMYHSALAVLETDYGGRFFIHPGQSFPVNRPEGLPQYVEKIYIEHGQLLFRSKEFDSKDALCCPSLQVTGRLFMKDGKWFTEVLKNENQ